MKSPHSPPRKGSLFVSFDRCGEADYSSLPEHGLRVKCSERAHETLSGRPLPSEVINN